ncbi:MAG: DUF6768 family protein [Pseudomonadota bacterium]
MTDYETRLRRSLDKDDEEFLKDLEDGRGMIAQIGATFSGPMGRWSVFVWVLILVMTAAGAYCVWQLFMAETTRLQILWLFGAWATWTAQVFLKKWVHDRMNTMSILREIKKVELRLIRLEEKQ